VRQNHYARERQRDRKRADRSAGAGRQGAGGRCQGSHVQRMARGKGIPRFSGKRDAVNVSNDRSTVRPGLVEQKFQAMRQQRRCDRDEQSMVAGAPQRLGTPARDKPAGGCHNQKDLLVGAPSQAAGQLLRSRRSIAGDRTRGCDIGSSRPDGDRKDLRAVKETC
jgi:hypothetical protein